MKIAIGTDHRGVVYKQGIIDALKNYEWVDVGTKDIERCNFPVYAQRVVQKIQDGSTERGVLLCGNGIGMSIAANRFPGMYAALVWNSELAKLCRQHNNANILAIPSDFVSLETAIEMVKIWCQVEFLGGRYQERIDIIDTFS
jgi:ribose 5-phosphate isomerase B